MWLEGIVLGSEWRIWVFGKGRGVGVVTSKMSWFNEGGFDVEGMGFVEHAFYQAFNSVLRGAVGSEAGDTEGARCTAED